MEGEKSKGKGNKKGRRWVATLYLELCPFVDYS